MRRHPTWSYCSGTFCRVQEESNNTEKDFVFLSKWSELEPFKEWTKAEANAIPVVNDPDAMYIMKTDAKEWAADEDTEKQMKSKL